MDSNVAGQKATVYLDGNMVSDGTSFRAETQCILLIAAYCGEPTTDLVLVCETLGQYPKNGIKIPHESFRGISFLLKQKIPTAVQACQLPAVFTGDEVNVYSGLCTVLRYLVKRSAHFSEKAQRKELLSLLGHRFYCLKSCSEVSPRTKMCELHMPTIINKLLCNETEIPEPIKLLENLLNEPVVIHNMDKRQRVLLRHMAEDSGASQDTNPGKRKKVVWTKDLPALEHAFAEGVDFTLTDLCIFPCVHCFITHNAKQMPSLSKTIPNILKWYGRLSLILRLNKALLMCNASLIDLSLMGLNTQVLDAGNGETEVLELNRNRTNCTKAKVRETEMTLRRDLPDVLAKLHNEGIQAEFMEYSRHDIKLDWSGLPKEIHPVEGELGSLRALRKCHQIENLARAVKDIAVPGDTIVDFCSGGGHVGIVLAYLLPQCSVLLVESKDESLDRARTRIYALNLKNITIYQCNLEYFRGTFQIGVALHACGVASDMVVQSCISKNASFAISPCCYGKVTNCHWISYPQSKLYRNVPISFEESLLLGHAADKTSWNFENKHAIEGKKCMGLVDLDRVSAAKECGYKVSIYTMQPSNCTPKNNMLVGLASGRS